MESYCEDEATEELPDEAGIEEALGRLYLLYKAEKCLRQADAGELVTQEEVRQRMGRLREQEYQPLCRAQVQAG